MGVLRYVACVAAVPLVAALFPLRALAQLDTASSDDDEEITIHAEQISYDQRANTVSARGNVVINRGETEVQADEVDVNRTTNEADARGHVRITDPEGTAFADAIHLNLDEETGWLGSAEIEAHHPHYSLRGERVEKGLGQSYHIENGRFTTCHCVDGPASWSVSGQDLRVTMGGYAALQRGTFNVLDKPVLYLPRAIFPVSQERQSGFLIPRFGYSNRRGFQTLLPAYWAIDKNQDATVALDVETAARLGLVGEYRYALSRNFEGILSGSYFNERIRGGDTTTEPTGSSIPQNRWSLLSEHDQLLPEGTRAYTDVFLAGDDRLVRDINTFAFEHARDVAIRTLPFSTSRIGLVHLWDRAAVKLEGTYYQNLTGPDSQVPQRAPSLDLWGQTLLGEHVMGDLSAEAVDFQRASGVDGARLDILPRATVPLPVGPYAFGTVHAAVRETAYQLTNDRLADNSGALHPEQSRETAELGAELNSAFNRVYPVQWFGLEKIKHTLEPEISYLYVPAVAQDDLPLFDDVDRVRPRNLITYGVVSRVIGKFLPAPKDDDADDDSPPPSSSIRELGRLSVMQSFDISRKLDPFEIGRAADHFSDIDVDGRINPAPAFSLRFHTNYDTTDNLISAARIGFFIEDPRPEPGDKTDAPRLETRTSAGVSYRFLNQSVLQEIDSSIVLRLTDWAGFRYSSRYDVLTNQFLDNYIGVRLISKCDCWALDIAVVDRTNPQEVEVRTQLTLVGLGSNKRERTVATAP
jgi:LPS-assembly protein